ncbi:MAG TPA: sodium/proline symporter [Myxococcota bacterium]|nr:sodium/proline symporter [Myxococcota bacterium]HRY96985.1 sodium/proline symporter [Myxococcota bacterium]HSA22992.1 sodium/proline symporter [Myxococcota bacterium]
MPADTQILIVVCVYLALLLGLGALAGRRTRSAEDFFLANRSLGAWVTAISSTASSESGWVVLGAVGMAYVDGVAALWLAPGCLMGYWVNLYVLAPRLRKVAADKGALTLPDCLVGLFGDRGHLLRGAACLVMLCCLAGYLAAQMTATGKALQGVTGLDYGSGVWVGGAVIVVYTLLGGFRAVAWTDFVQGLIMVFALVLMPILALAAAGGYGATLDGLARLDPNLVSLGAGKSGFALFGFLVGLLGIGLGYPGQPHVITRYMAAASDQKIRQTQVIGMVWGVLVFYGAGLLGLAGRLVMPELGQPGGDPEQLFPLLARQSLPPLLAGLMLAAVLSAIMSTVSSQLLVAASTVSRDILEGVFRLNRTGKASVLAGRLAVLVLGILAMLVASQDVRLVFWFVLFAWSGLGAAFGPVLLLGLFTRRLERVGAVAGMLTGFGVTIAWKATGLSDAVIYELVPAFFLAGLVALGVSAVRLRGRPGAA